jgi:2-oxoglutarate ferredoxin oxidoreductase subunit beta
MESLRVDEFIGYSCELEIEFSLEDYERAVPRWCRGCGGFGILSSLQKVFREKQYKPENVVAVSGIGCSSRFPYYINTYGFHGLHGRALPLATGVSLAQPDLKVMVTTGDGDCFSIGAGHWVHTLRYNPNIVVLTFDNGVYALTKKQVSPTTPVGMHTNTTPYGSTMTPMNPLTLIVGITNVSFLAQTATWLPIHMYETMKLAFEHKGLSFVRVLQRCPAYAEKLYGADAIANIPFAILESEEGIPVDDFSKRNGTLVKHNHQDMGLAQAAARKEYSDFKIKIENQYDFNIADGITEPIGLIYRNKNVPTYDEVRYKDVVVKNPEEKIKDFEMELDKYTI